MAAKNKGEAMGNTTGKLPPHDLEAEALICSTLLIHPDRAGELGRLAPCDCYAEPHALILQAAQALRAGGRVADAAAVRSWLSDAGKLAAVGGARYLGELLSGEIPYAADLAAQASRVVERAEARRMISGLRAVAADAYELGDPAAMRRALAELAATPDDDAARLSWIGAHALAAELAERPWAIRGLQIGPGRPCMVAAYAGTAKTIALQSLLLSYAAGRDVWDRFAVGAGGVAKHFDFEQGAYASTRRYQRLAYGMDVELAELADERLQLVSFPPLYLTTGDADRWEREIDGAGIVLIDSFRAATPGIDENAAEVRQYLDQLTRISERTGAAIVIIHHAGKAKDSHAGDARQVARGSSALFDAVGCAYLITMSTMAEPRRIRQTKLPAESDGATVDDGALVIEDVEGPTGDRHGLRILYQDAEEAGLRESPSRALADAESRLVLTLRGNPAGVSKRRLRALCGGARAQFDAALEGALDSGRIECVRAIGRSGGGMLYQWINDQ